MIKQLNISNFKLHSNTELATKGLTILTGMNGMGKSTIIQSLILLRQSYLMNDLDVGMNLKGDLCDAGISGELACQSSNEHYLNVELKFDNQKDLVFKFQYPDNIMDTLLPGIETNITDKNTLSKYSLFNDSFQYLSAFRFGPQKTYNRDTSLVVSKKQISKVMGQCEYAIHFLEHYKNSNIPIDGLAIKDENEDSIDYRLSTQVELWLRKISPNIKIKIEPIGEDLKLQYRFNREENTITEDMSALNTGFGITYVLPILISILSAKQNSIILIENPEAHIHPKGQAILMELMARAVSLGVQIIIETHSDHIINGSLVALKNEIINPEHLAIFYFSRDDNKHIAISHSLDISKSGYIKRPPKGFFDQIDIDLRTITGF